MKLFNCIIDDGQIVFKTLVAAKDQKELLAVYGGNKTFEKIQDVTADYLTERTVEKLDTDLLRMGWGEGERKFICALIQQHIDNLKENNKTVLNPCPFCGGEAKIIICDNEGNHKDETYLDNPYSGLGFMLYHSEVENPHCPIAHDEDSQCSRKIYDSLKNAEDAWNHRCNPCK